MTRPGKAFIAAIAVLFVVAASFALGYSLGERRDEGFGIFGGTTGQTALDVVDDAYQKIHSEAMDPPTRDELAQGAVKGMIRVLNRSGDRYALFYSRKGYREFREYTSGHFSGIGVWLKEKNGELAIISVLPSTPARAAGLRAGDVVERIDGKSVAPMTVEQAVNLIKGQPGTEVSLTVDRDGELLTYSITRAAIQLPEVVSRMTGADLGYVHVYGFTRGTGDELRNAVKKLTAKGARGVILDLRDNGGGLLSEAIDVASVFLETGKIVTYKQSSSSEVVYDAEGDAFDGIPLVVLVNEGTASASEIVAGALQDRDRAVLVGSTTYGKGLVQQVFPLGDASALKFTTGAYFTPSGRNINGKGIQPDVEVHAPPAMQKRRAIQILKGILASSNGAPG